ncbi:MAG: hypothetical protein QOK28_3907 [Actinomycetota bacterium]|jgi:hypothetical protein
MTIADDAWPAARLGNLARLRAVAAGLRGVHFYERVIDAPFADVWAFASDLERTTRSFEPDVHSLRVLERNGDHWKVRVRMPRWAGTAPLTLDVTMRDGWCWMVSRPALYVVGMAAEPVDADGSQTRFGLAEGAVLPVAAWAQPATRPLLAVSRWRHRFHVPRDVARLGACVTAGRNGRAL